MAFKVGDQVQLKSGGPVMTIKSMSTTEAFCQWFAGAKLNQGYFAVATLEAGVAKKKKEDD